ncbi:MAG: PEP-CTERM sorting domain-containing protein [Phycisphaerae bacterium]
MKGLKQNLLAVRNLALAAVATLGIASQASAQPGYITGDFHQHSLHSDGSNELAVTNSYNVQYGLDWWANSEHGGRFNNTYRWKDIGGYETPTGRPDNSWNIIKDARGLYPSKTIIQGLEFNAPGHEHVSTAVIADQWPAGTNLNPMAEFEYRFDAKDNDTSGGPGGIWTGKNTTNNHLKSVQAVQWMQTNYPTQSWFIPAHPERKNTYRIEHFRDFNNAGPTVAFGFESMPGHQKSPSRGGYNTNAGTGVGQPLPAGQGGTFGGTGVYAAKVGGWWDALLSEGRNWWLFASSDYHDDGYDFRPGEHIKTYVYVTDKNEINTAAAGQQIADGLRSGNSWVVQGDLIDSLEFTVGGAMMGGKGVSNADGTATVYIKVRDPDANNFNTYSDYINPVLDHIDLIAGHVTGKVLPFLDGQGNPTEINTGISNPAYSQAVSDAAVIARFDALGNVVDTNGLVSMQWTDLGDGFREMSLEVPVTGEMFFRLRGTNLGLNVLNETDGAGNPLADSLMGPNTAAMAFNDLWFYSNPVFVPEPETLGLLCIVGLGLLRPRRNA